MEHTNSNSSMLREGTILRGIYRVERPLSPGGFGNTYLATNTEFDELVAIKEFFLRGKTERDDSTSYVSVSNAENVQEFAQQLEKFKKEARRLRKLDNKHIVKVYDLFEENGTAYYVMDYIDGESLSDRLKRTGNPLAEEEVSDVLIQILDALHTVHEIELWHLDLKPANIMVDKKGQVRLIDFGASKHIDRYGNHATSLVVARTEHYFPPEQSSETLKNIGPWTDIYALGATLYHLLSNNVPPSLDELINEGTDAFSFPSTVSSSMRNLVVWMMKPNRKERPQSIEDIMDYLTTNGMANQTVASYHMDEKTILNRDGDCSEETDHDYREETMLDYREETVLENSQVEEEKTEGNTDFEESVYDDTGGNKKTIIYVLLMIVVCIALYSWIKNRSKIEISSTDNTELSDNAESGTTRVDYSWGSGDYTGGLKNGEPHGHGTIIYDDGKKFVGEFKDGKVNGHGVYTNADGKTIFDGLYEDGHRVSGTLTYDDGAYYTGGYYTGEYTWEWGTPHGQGTYFSASGDILFKGEYDRGKRKNGYGKEEDAATIYEGNYKDGYRSGKGTLTWKNALSGYAYKYVGNFVNGEKSNGRMYFVGGDMYEGTFKDGSWKNGTGTYYYASDHTYETGTFKNGELVKQTDGGTWEQ